MGYARLIDVQKETAVAIRELSFADFVPGDLAIPFETSSSNLHQRKVEIWTVPAGVTPPQER